MNYDELVQEVRNLPNVGAGFAGYLINICRTGRPSAAFLTLVPHRDGSWSATCGDLREKIEVDKDSDGVPLRFANEDIACRWAYEKIRSARSDLGVSAEKRESALKDAQEIHRLIRELDEAEGIE